MFQETELSYISGNGKPKNLLIFQEVNFRAQKKKKKNSYMSGIGTFLHRG